MEEKIELINNNDKINKRIEFLKVFFSIFNAYMVNIKPTKEGIHAFVEWKDEDELQEIYWDCKISDEYLMGLTKLIEYIINNKLIYIDKIQIQKHQLSNQLSSLGWTIEKTEDVIETLLSLKVDMIDCGQKTDSFFIHF